MTIAERLQARVKTHASAAPARLRVTPEVAFYVVLFALAAALRFWDLGARALHHDESIHAQWSWDLLRGGYRHNPIFHGPLYYHVQAAAFFLFGASDFTSRLTAAAFGTGLVALPLLLRRRLGQRGTMAAVAFIAFSPTLVYFSRFFREDIYLAVFTLLMVVAMWRYIGAGGERWLVLFALALAAAHATKEATYLLVAIFLLYLNGLLAWELARDALAARRLRSAVRHWTLAASLFVYAWAIAALWPWLERLRRAAGWERMPRSGDVLVLLGTLTVPLLAPVLKEPFESGVPVVRDLPGLAGVPLLGRGVVDPGQLDWPAVCQAAGAAARENALLLGGLFLLLVGACASIGLAWRPRTWSLAAGGAALLYTTLMTSLWTNLGGLCSGPWGSLDYWISQHDVRRGNQPWFYYDMLMPAYEFLTLSLALVGVWWALARGSAFSRFLVFWIVGVWAALSWAGEKMPWLNVHIALPVALLAAWTVERAWVRAGPLDAGRASRLLSLALLAGGVAAVLVYAPGGTLWAALRLAVLLLAAGFLFPLLRGFSRRAAMLFVVTALVGALALPSIRTMVSVTFERGDVPKDLLIYTQTSPSIPDLMGDITALAAATGQGYDLPIAVDTTDSFAWPWAWYLRDYRRVSYVDFSAGPPEGEFAVMLVNERNVSRLTEAYGSRMEEYAPPERYPHRWWFPETYKTALPSGPWSLETWQRLWDGITKEGWLADWYRFWRDHEPPAALGSVDGFAFFPANFDRSRDVISVQPLPPAEPTTDAEGRPMFGGLGTGPGRFLSPVDVARDGEGNLYVVDRVRKTLSKFTPEGRFVAEVVVAAEGEPSEPWGVTVAPTGEVVVADTFGWKVRIFSSDLRPLRAFGEVPSGEPPGPFELYGPRDVVVDGEGRLWVTDTGHDRILVYSLRGEHLMTIGSEGAALGSFDEPVGLALGPDGNVYVADMYNARVQVLSPDGVALREFAVPGWGGVDALDKPYLTVLADGRVAVSLPSRNEVAIYSPDGELLETIAPDREPLGRPYGVVEGADGRLWVVEGENARLRAFDVD